MPGGFVACDMQANRTTETDLPLRFCFNVVVVKTSLLNKTENLSLLGLSLCTEAPVYSRQTYAPLPLKAKKSCRDR
jgi:hypothetical protein